MPKLSEKLVCDISLRRNEPAWLLQWRLDGLAAWKNMSEPHWAEIDYSPIDYDDLNYYNESRPIDTSDLRATYEKWDCRKRTTRITGNGNRYCHRQHICSHIIHSRIKSSGNNILAIFGRSATVSRTGTKILGQRCAIIGQLFRRLKRRCFSDGTFVYVPPNTKCPIDLASYFRIETAKIGQFERTLIIADTGAELSYMEGCSAPRRPNHQLHSGVVEIVVHDNARVKYATVQNWYSGDITTQNKQHPKSAGGILNFVTKRGHCDKNARLDWTQVEVGSAMTWKYPSTILAGDGAASDFYSLAITRGMQQADTGTKMLHIGNDTVSNIVSYGVALDWSRQTFRSLVSFSGHGGKNASKCDTRIIGPNAIANTLPTVIHTNSDNMQSHEAATGAIDAAQLLYLMQAGISEDEAIAMIIGAVAAPIISRLPMEFLVESKQLIQMALARE